MFKVSTARAPHRKSVRPGLMVCVGLSVLAGGAVARAQSSVRQSVRWEEYLARQDLTWNDVPNDWWSGGFTGNGGLGTMVYRSPQNELRFEVGHTAVWDHQEGPNAGLGAMRAGKTRLQIGMLVLSPAGQYLRGQLRVDLWNAEVRGTINTTLGTISFRTFTHAEKDLQAIEIWTTGNETSARWRFDPYPARSPWGNEPPIPNPAPTIETVGEQHIVQQSLVAGGGFVTAWQEVSLTSEHRIVYLSEEYATQDDGYRARATTRLSDAVQSGLEPLVQTHRASWHTYYPQSFLSFPDPALEQFYWVQMYKLASATRAERPVYDLLGPWVRTTRWPGLWWNLNVQMTYWPIYTANRLALGESLTRALTTALRNGSLASNEPNPAFQTSSAAIATTSTPDLRSAYPLLEHCNLPWVLHNAWWQYRYSMNESYLRNELVPLLKRATNYYLLRLQRDASTGKLWIPAARSPEYDVQGPNPTVDVALLQWMLRVLLDADTRLNLADPQRLNWEQTLRDLVDLPHNDSGLLIATGVQQDHPHREPAHLLAIHPLHTLSWDRLSDRSLIQTSVLRWTVGEGTGLVPVAQDRSGYSFAWAASLYASMYQGDRALEFARTALTRLAPGTEVTPNTFYRDTEHATGETPMGVAAALQDMMLQSWGDRIRVFPAIPSTWNEVVFHQLRTEGAFLVSARRENGHTRWIELTSLAGAPCRVQSNLPKPWIALGNRLFSMVDNPDGTTSIDLARNESVVLTTAGDQPVLEVLPVTPQTTPHSDAGVDGARDDGTAPGTANCQCELQGTYHAKSSAKWLYFLAALVCCARRRRVQSSVADA